MKQINFPMLFLAILVVTMFSLVGIAIYYESFLLMALFFVLGFLFMGYGLAKKRANSSNH